MAISKININEFLARASDHIIIDVRSLAEYKHAHLPGAFNCPLFTDEERAAVGTAYKQESREKAIKIGLDFFGPKMRKIVEEVEQLCNKSTSAEFQNPNSQPLFIYCWRGGMRSAAIAWLLDLYGFRIYTLNGGYKSFRKYALEKFKEEYSFTILGGFTGAGKTEVLKELEKSGETVINLEEIACHKGSAFGNIGLPQQPTQEMFENVLAIELYGKSTDGAQTKIWLEDESQRLGLVNIPAGLWKTMRSSPIHFLDIDFEVRLDHIVEE